MQRSRSLNALVRLPALALPGERREARRYLRDRTKDLTREGPAEETPTRRLDGVRELTVTSLRRPRQDSRSGETYVPCLRLSGSWLGRNGFGVHARVVVKVEPGRLTVTVDGGDTSDDGLQS